MAFSEHVRRRTWGEAATSSITFGLLVLLQFCLDHGVTSATLKVPFSTFSEPQSPSPVLRSFVWTVLNGAS